ncbi:hypothetical protein V5799_024339 [Amblyomma americanum]|uniref:Uncharacterized protein n=1 Tax=Amblyomma americanum TaxID=6943 RepID=A0AAQ4ECC4_AMBAM
MIIDFRARSMKSEPPGSGRQPSGPFSGDMSKALTNGDRRPSEAVIRQVSLVAAFHDHISCAKSAELLDGMPCETDHLYAHCGDDAPDDSEQDRLRAIVVLHTDLIQHQQELIADRDRQIDELRAQRDELQANGSEPRVHYSPASVHRGLRNSGTKKFPGTLKYRDFERSSSGCTF